MQSHTIQAQRTTPAWCRKALRLLSNIDSTECAVAGLKLNGRWTTFTIDAEDLPTDEVVRICELVAGSRRSITDSNSLARSIAGTPLLDPEGTVVGALVALAPKGVAMPSSVESIVTALGGLVAPFVRETVAAADSGPTAAITTDPAFMVRVFGKIQPLVSEIVGFSDVLQREVIGTSRKRAGIIHKNGSHVVSTLKSVLDLVELETGAVRTEPAMIDMAAVSRQVLERHRQATRKKGLRVEFEGVEDHVDAEIDEKVLRRILDILFTNAIRYTDKGGVKLVVEQTATEARISVRDTGRGIRREFMPTLFEPFSADDAGSASDAGGIGMGLALAKRLAALIGASIAVDSRQGEGSSFTVVVPLIAPGGDTLDVADAEVDMRLDLSDKPLVLFVEDNAVARRVIEMMIGKTYEVVSVATVDEALQRAREHQFDLLLLDIALNERRTGVEVLQNIRKMVRYRDVPAIACTAYSLPGLRERYLSAGFDEYVAKPFRAEQLLDIVKTVLELGRREAPADDFEEEINIELPPLPDTLPKMLELISGGDDAVGTEEVTGILKSDPVATSWVLGHVNSAFYSVRGQVTTVERAVTLLGGEPICNLVVAGLLARTFEAGAAHDVRRVHEHIVKVSLGTAGFSRELAAALELDNPELAFTAGIMHDIGRMCLLAHDAPAYTKLWIEDDRVRAPELGQELLNFGIDHVSLGLRVSRKWSLPAVIHAVIDSYEKPDRAEAQHRSLASVVAVARAAALELMLGESPHLERAISRLEALYNVNKGGLLQLVREREQDVRSLIDSVRLG